MEADIRESQLVFAWLGAYASKALRLRLQDQDRRVRCSWHGSAEMQSSLIGAGLEVDLCAQLPKGVAIVALALLSPGTFAVDELRDWDRGGELQWLYLSRRQDAYSMRVRAVWELVDPRTIEQAYKPGTRQLVKAKVSADCLIFRPLLVHEDHPKDWELRSGGF